MKINFFGKSFNDIISNSFKGIKGNFVINISGNSVISSGFNSFIGIRGAYSKTLVDKTFTNTSKNTYNNITTINTYNSNYTSNITYIIKSTKISHIYTFYIRKGSLLKINLGL